MTPVEEVRCLAYEPFHDEGEVRRLADRIVTVRKQHSCVICRDAIQPGERVRAMTEVNQDDRQIRTFRFCTSCCEAMALSWTDSGRAMEIRVHDAAGGAA